MIATNYIAYNYSQLTSYEHGLSRRDESLKSSEMSAVIKVLTERAMLAKGHLDIGTFTARYVLGLRPWVAGIEEGGRIIGIDNSQICVSFAKDRVREEAYNEQRIHILEQDFLRLRSRDIGKFDLITAMLGTIAHFGYDKSDRHDDTLQNAVKNMANLLSEDGILVLSNWSERACATGDMLEIYDDQEREWLAEWTPGAADLRERLREAGLTILEEISVQDRLRMVVCGWGDSNIR